MRIFRRKPKNTPTLVSPALSDPDTYPTPQAYSDYVNRGYLYYSRNRFAEAEADFRKAIEQDNSGVNAIYALGMTLKSQKKLDESVQNFQKVISLLEAGVEEDKVKTTMVRRLALGHINEMQHGDWDLEKEIWHRVE